MTTQELKLKHEKYQRGRVEFIQVTCYRCSTVDYTHSMYFNPDIQEVETNGSWEYISVPITDTEIIVDVDRKGNLTLDGYPVEVIYHNTCDIIYGTVRVL